MATKKNKYKVTDKHINNVVCTSEPPFDRGGKTPGRFVLSESSQRELAWLFEVKGLTDHIEIITEEGS